MAKVKVLGVLILPWLALACAGDLDLPGTGIFVRIDAETETKRELAEVHFRMYRDDGDDWTKIADKVFAKEEAVEWPIAIPIGPEGEPERRLELQARALNAHGEVITQTRAVTRYVQGEHRVVPLWLADRCREQRCGDLDTCHGEGCRVCRSGACERIIERQPLPYNPDRSVQEQLDDFLSRGGDVSADGGATFSMQDAASTSGVDASACLAGQRHTPAGCMDLDECAADLDNCSENPEACIDRPASEGGFECRCPPGWEGDGIGAVGCVDIDECARGTHTCDRAPPATCINRPGDFECGPCGKGFRSETDTGEQQCVPVLDGLSVRDGVLSPAFDPQVTQYVVRLPLGKRAIELTAHAVDQHTLRVDGERTFSGQAVERDLEVGENRIEIEVQAPRDTRTYTVTLTRKEVTTEYLKAPSPAEMEAFGRSISLSADGNVLAVGAPDGPHTSEGNPTRAGSVYMFRRGANGWSAEPTHLKAPEPQPGDRFGRSVSLSADGRTLAVGAYGEDGIGSGAYVFAHVGGRWSESPVRLTVSTSEQGDGFGRAVSLSADGDVLAVGAHGEDSSTPGVNATPDEEAEEAGAVYVFTRNADGWSANPTYLKAPHPGDLHHFGASVSLSADGDVLAVGAPLDGLVVSNGGDAPDGGVNDAGIDIVSSDGGAGQTPNGDGSRPAGAVYIFTHGVGGWSPQPARLEPARRENAQVRFFGYAVSLSAEGDVVAVGAPWEVFVSVAQDGTSRYRGNVGGTYVFTRDGDAWSSEATRLTAHEPSAGELFGSSLSLSADGEALAVGAYGDASSAVGVNPSRAPANTSYAGAVHVFVRGAGSWNVEPSYVKASNSGARDYFGISVSLAAGGDVLAVGADGEDSSTSGLSSTPNDATESSGAVYVFR